MEKGTQTSDEESSSEAAPKTKPAPKGARPKSAARPKVEEAPNLEPVQEDETTWATVLKKKPLPVGPLAKEAKGKGKAK